MRKLFFIVWGLLLSATAAFAQRTFFQDSLLDQFAGNWVLRGTIDGKQTTHDVDARWLMDAEANGKLQPFARVSMHRK